MNSIQLSVVSRQCASNLCWCAPPHRGCSHKFAVIENGHSIIMCWSWCHSVVVEVHRYSGGTYWVGLLLMDTWTVELNFGYRNEAAWSVFRSHFELLKILVKFLVELGADGSWNRYKTLYSSQDIMK